MRDALGELARSEPYGLTHMAAGIDLATLELLGLAGSVGSPDPDSTKLILFFTDGQPTLPYLTSESGNVGAVEAAADRARRAGVRIHSFAIGPEALEGPIAAVEMAAITEGLFTPVPDPGRLSEFVDAMRLADVEEVAVRNDQLRPGRARGAPARRRLLGGARSARRSARTGSRCARARAAATRRARPSSSTTRRAPRAPCCRPSSSRSTTCCSSIACSTLGAEQRETIRRELILEIERERASALERAAAQRKELELRVLEPARP